MSVVIIMQCSESFGYRSICACRSLCKLLGARCIWGCIWGIQASLVGADVTVVSIEHLHWQLYSKEKLLITRRLFKQKRTCLESLTCQVADKAADSICCMHDAAAVQIVLSRCTAFALFLSL